MLTPQDDLIGHQLATTFDHVASSDPAWMERLWYTGHVVPTGDVLFDVGLGYHPNRNVMDGFAGVTVGRKQYNVRFSRHLRPDSLTTRIGPFRIEVVEGLRRHRLELGENPSSLRFELQFEATMNPHEETHHFRRRKGRVVEELARVQQAGRYSGWLEVDGRRYDLPRADWWGQRDHSWGLRHEMRTDETSPPLTEWPPFFYTWLVCQFPTGGLQWFFNQRPSGEFIYLTGEQVRPLAELPDPGLRIASIDHDFRFIDDPLGQTLEGGDVNVHFANGTRRTLEIRTLPARYYLKGGLYGGLRGWFHGDDRGPLYVEHDVWNLDDADTRRLVRTLSDTMVEVRDGATLGYGIIEYGVSNGYSRYPLAQKHPVF